MAIKENIEDALYKKGQVVRIQVLVPKSHVNKTYVNVTMAYMSGELHTISNVIYSQYSKIAYKLVGQPEWVFSEPMLGLPESKLTQESFMESFTTKGLTKF